jgi:hypothetical protein
MNTERCGVCPRPLQEKCARELPTKHQLLCESGLEDWQFVEDSHFGTIYKRGNERKIVLQGYSDFFYNYNDGIEVKG